ncbi:NIPSNAP family protein [Pseudonocardia sp. CA-107938]|uniref:NIPSNAP family protein n=1 Tax=Pseudonocardia sp. CA-107938 TaxID=3240021 RepID=UPI003D90DDCC
MLVEQRTYVLHAAYTVDDYFAAYVETGLPIQKAVLGGFLGYFVTEFGAQNELNHLWAYQDLEDRRARRARLAEEPEWQRCSQRLRPMIRDMRNKIMYPTSFSPIRELPLVGEDSADTAFTWRPADRPSSTMDHGGHRPDVGIALDGDER